MVSPHGRVVLADLSGAGIRLRPSEAVAIVRDIALQVVRGELHGIPSAHVIRFTPSGEVVVEGPVDTDGPDALRAAHLLDSLLASEEGARPAERVSGALRIVIARALGAIDLPPYGSLAAFAEALARFAASDVPAVVAELHARWSASVQAGRIAEPELNADGVRETATDDSGVSTEELTDEALTISDIRRARRETRLTLAEVSERSRIPEWLLRELEWGYFRNWPAGPYGRTQLVRYARAAGLDDRLVVRTVWPALDGEARRRGSAMVAPEDLVPADPEQVNAAAMLVPIERGTIVPLEPRRAAPRRYRLAAAAAITALSAVALIPAAWSRWSGGAPIPAATSDSRAIESSANGAAPQWVEPPGFASSETAIFADALPGEGIVPARHADGMTLRITRVADDGARNHHAQVSPNGERIAFDSDRDGPRGVYVANVDGQRVRRISGDGVAVFPSWSPDGTALLVARPEARRPHVWNLWRVDLDAGGTRRLTSHDSGQPWGGSWFPDGRRIAYTRDAALVVLDLETGLGREYPSPVSGRAIRGPAVSPDGREVIVQVLQDGGWLVNVATGSTRRAIDDPTAASFSWAPDGGRIAYYSGRADAWKIWVNTGSL
jgi:hypothetical protein